METIRDSAFGKLLRIARSLGGFAAAPKGWTWSIWQLLWVSGLALGVLFFLLPETYAPNILCSRARRIRKITGNPNYMSESELELRQWNPNDVLFEALVRPFQLCFFEPVVFLMNLYISLIYGILYIWFEAFPIVFSEIHGFNSGETGLALLSIPVSTCCITIPLYFYWKLKYQAKYFDENWNITPEYQLPPACVGPSPSLFPCSGCMIFNSIFGKRIRMASKYARHDT
ncbi:hypothetical protein AOCH_002403 [Aspergillus ochraceoroseus]|uniref:Caffeine resistance protein n=1 Tax=Aspergillus ochraceoroseus TaxID=138278 RepID=A0A0F8WLY3_9EURO|nr:hypothetical protein AOCH_002403 [Aspergillus ochraceoroseus]